MRFTDQQTEDRIRREWRNFLVFAIGFFLPMVALAVILIFAAVFLIALFNELT